MKPMKLILIVLLSIFTLYCCISCQEEMYSPVDIDGDGLPDMLPFDFFRDQNGAPVSQETITDFTKRLTGVWKKADLFNWLRFVTFGVEKDNPEGMPYFSNFWTGIVYEKSGDTVTFTSTNHGSDNASQRHATLFVNMLSAYLLTGDETAALLVDELARGLVANIKCMEWGPNVPEEDKYLLARYIIPHNYEKTLDDGKTLAVDLSTWQHETSGRVSNTIYNENNPYWGSIYVKNERSKDDIGQIYRAIALAPYGVNKMPYPYINDALQELYQYYQKFAIDVVTHDYAMRTRDHEGEIYIANEDHVDLNFYGDDSECPARLATHLLAYEDSGGIYCGNGIVSWYEEFALTTHLFVITQIWNNHLSAVLFSLINEEYELAQELLGGLATRMDNDINRTFDDPGEEEEFKKRLTGNLIRFAGAGLPLNNTEVRFIHEQVNPSIDYWNQWEYWDMWDSSVPDGTHYDATSSYYPSNDYIRFRDMTSFFQLCSSPFYNEAGAQVVDCDIIANPELWGE